MSSNQADDVLEAWAKTNQDVIVVSEEKFLLMVEQAKAKMREPQMTLNLLISANVLTRTEGLRELTRLSQEWGLYD